MPAFEASVWNWVSRQPVASCGTSAKLACWFAMLVPACGPAHHGGVTAGDTYVPSNGGLPAARLTPAVVNSVATTVTDVMIASDQTRTPRDMCPPLSARPRATSAADTVIGDGPASLQESEPSRFVVPGPRTQPGKVLPRREGSPSGRPGHGRYGPFRFPQF